MPLQQLEHLLTFCNTVPSPLTFVRWFLLSFKFFLAIHDADLNLFPLFSGWRPIGVMGLCQMTTSFFETVDSEMSRTVSLSHWQWVFFFWIMLVVATTGTTVAAAFTQLFWNLRATITSWFTNFLFFLYIYIAGAYGEQPQLVSHNRSSSSNCQSWLKLVIAVFLFINTFFCFYLAFS